MVVPLIYNEKYHIWQCLMLTHTLASQFKVKQFFLMNNKRVPYYFTSPDSYHTKNDCNIKNKEVFKN